MEEVITERDGYYVYGINSWLRSRHEDFPATEDGRAAAIALGQEWATQGLDVMVTRRTGTVQKVWEAKA